MTDDAHEELSIHWISEVVNRVLERDADEYIISSGKSPSGSIHIGFMRELIISDVIKRELVKLGKRAKTMFVVDDYDPVRSFPKSVSLKIEDWVGIPYCDVPDEFGCCESYGAHWANELIETFPEFGVDPEVVWTSKIYETPEMRKAVRTCLKNTEVIREIMIDYVGRDFNNEQREKYIQSMKNWYPASVVCPKCGHLQSGVKGEIRPNRVTVYDPENDLVSFTCHACGHSDTLPLTDVRIKLVWRVDWPSKWYILSVTCEPAGKDHAVKGGSYDTGLEISRRVFKWDGPVKVPYEWVRIGGRDMSTSEGIVFVPHLWAEIAPPELYRFFMLRTDLARAINIQPERLPDLIDEYERFERIYYGLEKADGQYRELVKLVYPLTLVGEPSAQCPPKLPFKYAIVMSQLEGILGHEIVLERSREVIMKQHNIDTLTEETDNHIVKRLNRARRWVELFGSKNDRIDVPDRVPDEIRATLTDTDKEFLKRIVDVLQEKDLDEDTLQSAVFEEARAVGLKERRAFMVLYRILISRKSGPRLAPFIKMLGQRWVADRISSVL